MSGNIEAVEKTARVRKTLTGLKEKPLLECALSICQGRELSKGCLLESGCSKTGFRVPISPFVGHRFTVHF